MSVTMITLSDVVSSITGEPCHDCHWEAGRTTGNIFCDTSLPWEDPVKKAAHEVISAVRSGRMTGELENGLKWTGEVDGGHVTVKIR